MICSHYYISFKQGKALHNAGYIWHINIQKDQVKLTGRFPERCAVMKNGNMDLFLTVKLLFQNRNEAVKE